jgi:hypothetical protein
VISTLAAILLAAAPASAVRLPDAITDTHDPAGRAVNCAAYLGHQINALPRAGRPRLVAAMQAWRAELRRRLPRDEADQYFASTFAVLGDTPAPVRTAAAAYCRSRAPARVR